MKSGTTSFPTCLKQFIIKEQDKYMKRKREISTKVHLPVFPPRASFSYNSNHNWVTITHRDTDQKPASKKKPFLVPSPAQKSLPGTSGNWCEIHQHP